MFEIIYLLKQTNDAKYITFCLDQSEILYLFIYFNYLHNRLCLFYWFNEWILFGKSLYWWEISSFQIEFNTFPVEHSVTTSYHQLTSVSIQLSYSYHPHDFKHTISITIFISFPFLLLSIPAITELPSRK